MQEMWSKIHRQGIFNRSESLRLKMVDYKCFSCNKTISEEQIGKRVRCLYCGAKILFKPRVATTKIKAR